MPTYEYKCNHCGHRFEKFHSMSAAPIRKCPECGKNAVERLIGTGAGLIFKGSGFYITDYRDSSYKEKAKAESGESTPTKSEGAKEGAADAKPAAESKAAAEPKASPAAEAKTPAKAEPKPAKPEAKASSPKSRSRN
jgi:putative FmdB family regulatory protein